MSNVKGVEILKTTGKLSAGAGASDAISGLIAIAPAASGLAVNVSKKLESIRDAIAVGIDADYDTTNSETLYRNISEFFRLSPKGVLWIMLAGAATTPATILDDATNTYAKKLLTDAGGEIRQLAIAINDAALAGTTLNGLPTEVHGAIAKAQTLAEWAYTNFKPCNIILEGCEIAADLSTLGDLRDITDVIAPKVSVVIGQDKAVADLGAAFSKRAAVGALLGMISRRKVNENIGWVEDGNLTSASQERFLAACLSNGSAIESAEADWQTLEDKGYIFVQPYTGIDGYYFNNDHTCCAADHDEAFISRGRVKDKASRLLRTAYLPKVKSPQPVDPDSGKLPAAVVEYFNTLGSRTLERSMLNESEISGFKVVTDPDSDLINTPKQLKVAFAIVPYGEAGEIKGTLEFTNSLSN